MASVVNFDLAIPGGFQGFNIQLDSDGNLNFRANEQDGGGPIRLAISDNSGEVTIGGSGEFGALQLKGPSGSNTIFIGANLNEANASLGGRGLSW